MLAFLSDQFDQNQKGIPLTKSGAFRRVMVAELCLNALKRGSCVGFQDSGDGNGPIQIEQRAAFHSLDERDQRLSTHALS